MFGEQGNFPIAGGVLLAVGAYALVSLFISGPVIGSRTIEKSNWHVNCRAEIRAAVQEKAPPQVRLPSMCRLLFSFHGQQGSNYCDMHGHHFDGPANKLIDGLNAQKRALHEKRMSRAAGKSRSRCDCAANLTLEKRRTDWAFYAGSLRLVTPQPVNSLRSELITALNSPLCSQKG